MARAAAALTVAEHIEFNLSEVKAAEILVLLNLTPPDSHESSGLLLEASTRGVKKRQAACAHLALTKNAHSTRLSALYHFVWVRPQREKSLQVIPRSPYCCVS